MSMNDPAVLSVVVPCGGTGSRAGAGLPKQHRRVAGRTVLEHTLCALASVTRIDRVVLVVAADDGWVDEGHLAGCWNHWRTATETSVPETQQTATPARPNADLVVCREAGPTRAHTVAAGLKWLKHRGGSESDWVLVHDAARCLVTPAQINKLLDQTLHDPVGGLLALKLPDTLKASADGRAATTVPREDKWLAQTPQMFRLGTLDAALERAEPAGYQHITDESSAVEAMGLLPRLVEGSAENFKLTYPADFALAEAILAARMPQLVTPKPGEPMTEPSETAHPSTSQHSATKLQPNPKPLGLRIGEGWDCHALVPGRPLVLGGVRVPHTHGLLGHSDADVLLHAITDAVLGAAGLGDIGRHFPDTDARYKGADSRVLLQEAMERVRAQGWVPGNVDCTVVAQAPKLAGLLPSIAQSVALALGLPEDQVNVKAKTAERLGPVGQGLSMEARAVVLLVAASGAT